jgi:hypothetical protein
VVAARRQIQKLLAARHQLRRGGGLAAVGAAPLLPPQLACRQRGAKAGVCVCGVCVLGVRGCVWRVCMRVCGGDGASGLGVRLWSGGARRMQNHQAVA